MYSVNSFDFLLEQFMFVQVARGPGLMFLELRVCWSKSGEAWGEVEWSYRRSWTSPSLWVHMWPRFRFTLVFWSWDVQTVWYQLILELLGTLILSGMSVIHPADDRGDFFLCWQQTLQVCRSSQNQNSSSHRFQETQNLENSSLYEERLLYSLCSLEHHPGSSHDMWGLTFDLTLTELGSMDLLIWTEQTVIGCHGDVITDINVIIFRKVGSRWHRWLLVDIPLLWINCFTGQWTEGTSSFTSGLCSCLTARRWVVQFPALTAGLSV